MDFTNEITLALPRDDVFAALTDVERVASCLPGARLEGRDGDVFKGAMRIKVGPILADYHGTIVFQELDTDNRRAILLASGEETGGQGSARARIVSSVLQHGDGARIVVKTELQVVGRVAQFGSGAMEKIAKRMFADFAGNLERVMTTGVPATPVASTPSGTAAPATAARAPAAGDDAHDALDVLDLVGGPAAQVLRRAVPPIIAFVIGYLLGQLRARPAP